MMIKDFQVNYSHGNAYLICTRSSPVVYLLNDGTISEFKDNIATDQYWFYGPRSAEDALAIYLNGKLQQYVLRLYAEELYYSELDDGTPVFRFGLDHAVYGNREEMAVHRDKFKTGQLIKVNVKETIITTLELQKI